MTNRESKTASGGGRVTTMRMGEHELSLEDCQEVGEYFSEKGLLELRETEENRAAGLEQLRELVNKNGDLNVPVDDDIFLLPFLRSCKFYPESAFKRDIIDLIYAFVKTLLSIVFVVIYIVVKINLTIEDIQALCTTYQFKDKNPKYCRDLRPSQEGNVFMHNIFTVLPYRDQHGRRILLLEAGKKWDTKKVSITEIIRGIIIIVEAALLEPKTQIAGASIMIDLEGLSLNHVWQFSPHLAKVILEYVQECVPLRLKGVHIINQPYIFNMLFQIFKPFIGEKLRNRIYFHGDNRASLMEHFDAKFIPTQYGGEMVLKTVYGPELHKLICQFEQEFIEGNSRGFKSAIKKK